MRKRQGKRKNKLSHVDLICCNIYCARPLTDFELERQNKQYRYRFCIKCRMKVSSRTSFQVSWRCLGCGVLLANIDKPIGKYYCKPDARCDGRAKKKLIQQARSYKRNKLARSIIEQGGFKNYKCNTKI